MSSSIFSFFPSQTSASIDRYPLTDEQRRMYASEKLDNFRWVAKLFAKCSKVELCDDTLASETISREVAEYGQFAEVIYSDIPIKTLLKHFQSLNLPGYPLEFYGALRDCELIDSFRGSIGDLPAFIFFRPLARQLIISISGTASLLQSLYDLRVMKKPHPSGIGAVHSGFLALYGGIKGRLLQQIREALAKHSPLKLILTGHSMGGSLAYLLLLDLLAEGLPHSICSEVRVCIATYGAPRTGDKQLVDHFHSVIQQHRSKFKLDETFLVEYAVQGFNDGIPATPPASWGYRHFCRVPLYSAGGRLYRPPAPNESQVMFFPPEEKMRIFPRGGHNYYNGRDLELLRRRIGWLTSANIEKPGWESRYKGYSPLFESAM